MQSEQPSLNSSCFSTEGDFVLWGHLAMSADTFWLTVGGILLVLLGRGQGCS